MIKILVIDDEEQIREILKQMLERKGCSVCLAENGEEALEICENQNLDLIITDMVMPGKSGLKTIQEVKKNYPDIKIIAISGGYMVGPKRYLDMAKTFGADRFFEKPFTSDEIYSAIEELVDESQAIPNDFND
ncbi:response regulator [Thermodesulfobacteriota bacterium]